LGSKPSPPGKISLSPQKGKEKGLYVKNLRNQSLPLRTFNADCEQEAPIVEKTLIKGLFDLFNTFLNRFKSLLFNR
jgi:hypothetical protein